MRNIDKVKLPALGITDFAGHSWRRTGGLGGLELLG
jgi:hypothetical protein